MTYSEDEIYELSLAREPRTSVSSVCAYFFKVYKRRLEVLILIAKHSDKI